MTVTAYESVDSLTTPQHEASLSASTRAKVRVGIYDPSDLMSGLTRYINTLLDGLDRDQFEITLFHHPLGPHRQRPRTTLVPIPVQLDAPRGAQGIAAAWSSAAPSASGRRFRRAASALWRQCCPGAVKLWAGYLRDSRGLARLFREHPVDLMHMQLVGGEAAALGARLAGVPCVLGTFQIDSARSTLRDWVVEFVSNHSIHRAVAVSHATGRDWARRTLLPAERVSVIPNAIDTRQFQRRYDVTAARQLLGLPTDGRVVIGAVGRLHEQKGYKYLLEAAAVLRREQGPESFIITIAGEGPLGDALRAQAKQLDVTHCVRFLGFCKDVQPVLDASDIFVLPSMYEALPFALLEAMAAGLPAVGTTVAGVPEVIVPGETGLLVPPADVPALTNALRQLMTSPAARAAMGRAARQRVVALFDCAPVVKQTVEIYRNMLKSREIRRARHSRREGILRRPAKWAIHREPKPTQGVQLQRRSYSRTGEQ
jgi:glycosyltransferase involved in cell wall biosynthesis